MHIHIDKEGASHILEAANRTKERTAKPVHDVYPMLSLAAFDGLEGTALEVDDNWYARIVGKEGVLVPLRGETSILDGLRHGGRYKFEGTPSKGFHGEVNGILLRGLETLD